MSLLSLLFAVFVVNVTIGFMVARWVISQYSHGHNTNQIQRRPSTGKRNSRSRRPSLSRLPSYDGLNPFHHKPLSAYEQFKVYFMCCAGIVWFRIAWFVTTMAVCAILGQMTPYVKLSKINRTIGRIGCRIALFGIGFYRLQIYKFAKGQNRGQQPIKKARVIVSNHHTIVDAFIVLAVTNGTIAVKKELRHMPLFGTALSLIQTIFIDRTGTNGRRAAKQQIVDHLNNDDLPPLIVFPQGTTTSVNTLTTFKTGAFLSKKNVQPLALDWSRNRHADLSFLLEHPLAATVYMCSQFVNHCDVRVLDVYQPNTAERSNVQLLANNVRDKIVEALRLHNKSIKTTPHSLSDFRIASKSDIYLRYIIMGDVHQTLRLKTKTVLYLVDKFQQMDPNKSGFIEYDEFRRLFGVDSDELSALFQLFDTTETDERVAIGFDEFMVGVATCYVDDLINDAIQMIFGICAGNKSVIKKDDIVLTYARFADKEKFEYHMLHEQMRVFCERVFGEEQQLEYEKFLGIITNDAKNTEAAQHFLQSTVIEKFDVHLEMKDFV